MEIFELRYFLEVAKHENIHRASERLRVSPGSLSKAVARIEAELQTKLFVRDGRNIRLTEPGKLLKLRASQMVQLEEATRVEITGHQGQIRVVIAGPEVLLSQMGLELAETLLKRHPRATFEFQTCDDMTAIQKITQGEAHLGLVTGEVPSELTSKAMSKAKFITVVGRGHPLYPLAKQKKSISVSDLLQHPFVSPSRPILGRVGSQQALDGWRDDPFTRKVSYLTQDLGLLGRLVSTGKALAHLPDYYATQLDVLPLHVTGCPYSCVQTIQLIARRPKDIGWMNRLF